MYGYKRNAVFTELKEYDHMARDDDFMEVCEWKNGDGFDVEVEGKLKTRFQLTWGEYNALIELVKELEK